VNVTQQNAPWLTELAKRDELAGQRDSARRLAEQILEVAPTYAEALNLAGVIALREQRHDEAVRYFTRAVAVNPSGAMYHRNLCEIYRIEGMIDRAIAHGERARELAPNDAEAHYLVSVAHYFGLDMARSMTCARQALALDPQHCLAHFQLATALLVTGEFGSGFAEYEWRWKHPGAPVMVAHATTPRWDGKPTDETLLLLCDQGYGDVIQFARYVPMLLERCPNVVVSGPEGMVKLLDLFPELKSRFVPLEAIPDHALHCAVSSLPHAFGTTLDTVPAQVPYIELPAAPRARKRRNARRRIGIVWAGGTSHVNDRNRSAALADLQSLAALDGIDWVSLQVGEAKQQAAEIDWAMETPLGDEPSFVETATVIQTLDLVIAVDTSVAHLAGAMGKPTWLLLSHSPEWRWLLDRSDSPWYPTMRLFRQKSLGDWTGLARDVRDVLSA
jgi:Flp pilus assembly protein TadD